MAHALGTVTLTATSATNPAATASVTVQVLSDTVTHEVRIMANDLMHYRVNGVLYTSSTTIRLPEGTKITFTEEQPGTTNDKYVITVNDQFVYPNADGNYVIPELNENATISFAYTAEGDQGTQVSFWELIVRFFRKIVSLFNNLFA